MLSGLFRQAWSPSLTPCPNLFRTQQLTNLRQFRPFSRPRTAARAATLQPTQRKDQVASAPVVAEFRHTGLSAELVVATEENGLREPTEIQVNHYNAGFPVHNHFQSLTSTPIPATGSSYPGCTWGWGYFAGFSHRLRKDTSIPAASGMSPFSRCNAGSGVLYAKQGMGAVCNKHQRHFCTAHHDHA